MSQETNGPQRGWQSLVGDVVIGGDRALTEQGHWEACSTIELYNGVHAEADPQQVHNRADEWEHLGGLMSEHTDIFEAAIQAHTHHWSGAAAEGARHTLNKLVAWSTQASRTASAMAPPLRKQGEILARARASMPEPVADPTDPTAAQAFSGNGVAGISSAATDMAPGAAKARRGHQQAVDAMRTMEESSREVDASVPEFVPPESTGPRHHQPAPGAVVTPAKQPDTHHGEQAPPPAAVAPGHPTSPASTAPQHPTSTDSPAPGGSTDFRPPTPAQPQATTPAGIPPAPAPDRGQPYRPDAPATPRPRPGPVVDSPAITEPAGAPPRWDGGTKPAGTGTPSGGDRGVGPTMPRPPIAPDEEVGGLRRDVGSTLNPHANAPSQGSALRRQLSGGDSAGRPGGQPSEGGRSGAGQARPSAMNAQTEPGKAPGSPGSRMAPSGVGAGKPKRGEDTEHKSADYLREDKIFDVPEARKLPPPVIGERKPAKRKPSASKKDSPPATGSAKSPAHKPKQ